MSALRTILKYEYIDSLKGKTFWIQTILFPILIIAFSFIMVYHLSDGSEQSQVMYNEPYSSPVLDGKSLGIAIASALDLFLLIYGALIFNRVKKEKTSRLAEILASSVSGRDLMLGKIISSGLLGLTQIFVWFLITTVSLLIIDHNQTVSLLNSDFVSLSINDLLSILWIIPFFIAGYCFYAALYAICGAISGSDNENHGYLNFLTVIILISYNVCQGITSEPHSLLANVCSFIPFSSPMIAPIFAIQGSASTWLTITRLLVLSGFGIINIKFAGKIYMATLMMKGKKLSPSDLIKLYKMQ